IMIEAPWSWRGGVRKHAEPAPELAGYRNLIDHLSGRRVVDEFPVGDGGVAYILEGEGDDSIIAWRDYDAGTPTVISAYLAAGPVTLVDIFGNRTELAADGGLHRIELRDEPVFIEGVNVNLARFRAGFAIEPNFVPSTASSHELALLLKNPWPGAVTGRLRIVEPADWKISPRLQSFSIPGDGMVSLPFEAVFGVGEEAGPAKFSVEFELSADRNYPHMALSSQVEIGLPTVQITPTYRIERDSSGDWNDLTVNILVTNISERPITVQVFAMAPGFPRQQAPVSDLPPNESVVKRFRFVGGGKSLRGDSVRVGLIENDGFGRLNKSLEIQ
ncbi:MAG: hypothetical protein VYC34_07210, partial [Planctomycetota bacterium]|nr:hypothetical protein [Planctomycetota bacterium]